MNSEQIFQQILETARSLQDSDLDYIAGNNSIRITEIDDERITALRGEKSFTIPIGRIKEIASHLAGGKPIHVDSVFQSSGNFRSALEAIVAHDPHVGHLPANSPKNPGPKKLVWFTNEIHALGEVLDATEILGYQNELLENEPTSFPATRISKALLTKPFLILTGPSGTGKTRGAIELAGSICNANSRELVAVGADWTDNRQVFGYLNPLDSILIKEKSHPVFEASAILKLILRALEFSREPHVLILDEMNLSHVERYFSDFLSAMELEDKSESLKLHEAGTAYTREKIPVPGKVDFPTNLFVIGTVNIDETTYMFSPKVLDRANVIEVKPDPTHLKQFLESGVSREKAFGEQEHGISFLELAETIHDSQEHRLVPDLPLSIRKLVAEELMNLFAILDRGRSVFGYRTGKEIMDYMRLSYFLAGTEEDERYKWIEQRKWETAIDHQILQKILPKLYGSRSRIAPLLGALATYCGSGEVGLAMKHFAGETANASRSLENALELTSPTYSDSYTKLSAMIEILVEEQFVSFVS